VCRDAPNVEDMTDQFPKTNSVLSMLLSATPPIPAGSDVMTATIELPPGDQGTPPHRHSGPVFGYMLEGEMIFELEGEPERLIKAGEAFWEPGGDLMHYRAANSLPNAWSRFVVVMICAPGQDMMTFPDAEELAARAHLRAPRAVAH
jgi:quercetin dioxygenase-like cupin family protein